MFVFFFFCGGGGNRKIQRKHSANINQEKTATEGFLFIYFTVSIYDCWRNILGQQQIPGHVMPCFGSTIKKYSVSFMDSINSAKGIDIVYRNFSIKEGHKVILDHCQLKFSAANDLAHILRIIEL